MMKISPWPVLLFIAIMGGSISARPPPQVGDQIVRVFPKSDGDLKFIRQLEKRNLQLKFWTSGEEDDKPAHVDIAVSPHNQQIVNMLLKTNNVEYKITFPNTAGVGDDHVEERDEEEFSFSQYHKLEEINLWLTKVALEYPDLVTLLDLGKSYEGRSITAVKISSGGGGRKKAIWLDAAIHSNEWIGPATMIYFINYFVSNYGSDREAMWLVDNLDWYILPVFNVDGYVYSWTHDRMWRKNRAVHGNGTCVGTDLNRNWPTHWGEDGVDHDPCGRTYLGEYAMSEPETRAVADFLSQHNDTIKAYLAYHSFSQYWMLPYSYTKSINPPNMDELMNMSRAAVEAIKSVHGTKYKIGRISDLIGASSGASVDFTYKTLGIPYSFGIELRDEGRYGTRLPADEIIPNSEESLAAIKTIGFVLIDIFYDDSMSYDLVYDL